MGSVHRNLLFTGHKQLDFDAKTGCFLVVNRWISEESENRKVKNPNALLSGERRTKREETTFDVSQFKC